MVFLKKKNKNNLYDILTVLGVLSQKWMVVTSPCLFNWAIISLNERSAETQSYMPWD